MTLMLDSPFVHVCLAVCVYLPINHLRLRLEVEGTNLTDINVVNSQIFFKFLYTRRANPTHNR